jgi:hypothetical protein
MTLLHGVSFLFNPPAMDFITSTTLERESLWSASLRNCLHFHSLGRECSLITPEILSSLSSYSICFPTSTEQTASQSGISHPPHSKYF